MNDLFDNRFIVNHPDGNAYCYNGAPIEHTVAANLLSTLSDSVVADCGGTDFICPDCPLDASRWNSIEDNHQRCQCFMRRTPAYHNQLRQLCEQYES